MAYSNIMTEELVFALHSHYYYYYDYCYCIIPCVKFEKGHVKWSYEEANQNNFVTRRHYNIDGKNCGESNCAIVANHYKVQSLINAGTLQKL